MKIMVATDGSLPAGVALRLVAAAALPAGTQIRIVTAVDTGSALFGGPWPTAAITQAAEVEAALRDLARRALDSAVEPFAAAGRTVVTAVLEGRPATVLVEEAERWGADLLVVGSRGHGLIESMVLGSVTAEILDSARVPVLVVRAERLSRVVLAWDGSEPAGAAATILETWPFLRSAPVRVVTVLESPMPWWAASMEDGASALVPAILEAMDAARAEHERLNAEGVARLVTAGIAADGEVRQGDAAQALLAAAQECGADLIALGTHGRAGLARLALGSVARNLVNHAPCSVLVVRGPGGGGDSGAGVG